MIWTSNRTSRTSVVRLWSALASGLIVFGAISAVPATAQEPVSEPGVRGDDPRETRRERLMQRIGLERRTLEVGGLERSYVLYAPGRVAEADADAPLVLSFHGGGGRAEGLAFRYGFQRLARREGFLVAYPQGVDGHWNDGRNARVLRTQREGIDDIAFVRAVVEDIARDYPVDTGRIFATGISNGGIFCHRLAAEASDLVVAVAPIVGGMAEPMAPTFAPKRPVSLLVIQGDADPLVPFEGGPIGVGRFGRRGRIIATDATVAKYRQRNGIEGEPMIEDLDDRTDDGTTTQVTTYPTGEQGTRVVVYRIRNGGHAWPTIETPNAQATPREPNLRIGLVCRDFSATRVVWDFFKACPTRD